MNKFARHFLPLSLRVRFLTPDAPHWVVFPAVEAADGGHYKMSAPAPDYGRILPALPRLQPDALPKGHPPRETYEYQTLQKFLHL